MHWIDIAIILLILLSSVISIFRGIIKEVLSLVAWVAAFYLALRFSGIVAGYLEPYISIEPVRLGVAFLGIFFLTLILFSLFNFVIARLVDGTGLSGTDRFLGVIFGLIRGVAIVTILVVFAQLTPVPQGKLWQRSLLIPYFQKTAVWVKQYIPENLSERFSYSASSNTIQTIQSAEINRDIDPDNDKEIEIQLNDDQKDEQER
jgi:membrane protein required for colicin V production